jgi:hypothetical protein
MSRQAEIDGNPTDSICGDENDFTRSRSFKSNLPSLLHSFLLDQRCIGFDQVCEEDRPHAFSHLQKLSIDSAVNWLTIQQVLC